MTSNDDFTRDARAEAEKRADLSAEPLDFEHGLIVKDFMAGAEWARDYLTEQKPTDAEVLVAMTAYEGHPDRVSGWRAALTAAWSLRAARATRRDEEKRDD